MVLAPTALAPSDVTPPDEEFGGELAPVDVETIEKGLLVVLQDGYNDAVGMHQERKFLWAQYDQMADGRGVYTDQQNPLVQMGVHLPVLAKKCDILRSSLLKEFFPDTSSMEFFMFSPKIQPGLDFFAAKCTAGLVAKFQSMKPANAQNFVDLSDLFMQSFFRKGNCFGLIGHEAMDGDGNDDGIIQGPMVSWLDPMNVWPWCYDVDSIDMVPCTSIYAPIDVYQLTASSSPNLEALLEETTPTEDTRRDRDSLIYQYGDAYGNYLWSQYQQTNLYRRFIEIGRFPGEDLRECSGLENVPDEEMIAVLAAKYGFDPVEAMTAQWWHFERIGNVMMECKPYLLALPAGSSPILHGKCFTRPGLLMGLGVYDRAGWDEKLLNFYHRAGITLTHTAMTPPWTYRKDLVDPTWLQQQGQEAPQLVPGAGVPIVGEGKDPIMPILYNIEAVPISREQRAVHEMDINELTGVTSALEGEDNAKTATQAQNNLQQSMTMRDYYAMRFGFFLVRVVQGAYLVWDQMFKMAPLGFQEHATADIDEQGLQSVTITREDLVSLRLLNVVLTGASAPGNRMNQAQLYAAWAQKYIALGVVNPVKAAEDEAELGGFGGMARAAIVNIDPTMLMAGMQNRQSLLGPGGAQAMTSPQDQQGMMALQAPAPPAGGQQQPPQMPGMQPIGAPGGTGGFAGQ